MTPPAALTLDDARSTNGLSDESLRRAFGAQLRDSARSSAVLGGTISLIAFPLWSVFDLVLLPERALSFIVMRLATEVLLLTVWMALRSDLCGPRWSEPLAFLVPALPHAAIAWMIPRSAPHLDAYLLGFSTVIYGSAVLLMWRWQLQVLLVAFGLSLTGSLILLEQPRFDTKDLVLTTFYLGTASGIAVAAQRYRHRRAWAQFLTEAALDEERQRNDALIAQLQHLSHEDELTGVANRRAWDAWIVREQRRARRHRSPLTLIFCDLDHLKDINDHFGHPAGDAALQASARVLVRRARATDLVARVGGDEFAIGCPDTTIDGAFELAANLAQDIHATEWPDGAPVTLSFGIAELVADETVNDLMERADSALYRAKATRDTICRA